jgi:membrane peptidoglycan carboxypeptidase
LLSSVTETYDQVIDKNTSQALINMLVGVVQSGTGQRAKIADWHIAGKTGTSQNARDAWFIGFTSSYIVGIWMGSDDNTPLNGVVGGNLPSMIWAEISKKIHLKKPNSLPTLSTIQFEQSLGRGARDKEISYRGSNNKPEDKSIFKRLFDYLNSKR